MNFSIMYNKIKKAKIIFNPKGLLDQIVPMIDPWKGTVLKGFK